MELIDDELGLISFDDDLALDLNANAMQEGRGETTSGPKSFLLAPPAPPHSSSFSPQPSSSFGSGG
jgi:hypothetical protein